MTHTEASCTYDGFGININDVYHSRILNWAKQSTGDYVLTEEDRKRLGPILAAAPALYALLKQARLYLSPSYSEPCTALINEIDTALAQADGKEAP